MSAYIHCNNYDNKKITNEVNRRRKVCPNSRPVPVGYTSAAALPTELGGQLFVKLPYDIYNTLPPPHSWVRIHQPFSRTFFVFSSKICKF